VTDIAPRLIDLLPPSMTDDELVRRFVSIFDRITDTVAARIDHASDYFDLTVAPPELVRLIASWVNIPVPEVWAPARQREFVMRAVAAQSWRGTARGLRIVLEAATGCEVEIDDPATVTNESLDAAPAGPVVVRLRGRCDASTHELVERMVRAQMPVGIAHRLEIDDAGDGDV
jgi:phage tail-like protein